MRKETRFLDREARDEKDVKAQGGMPRPGDALKAGGGHRSSHRAGGQRANASRSGDKTGKEALQRWTSRVKKDGT